MIDLTGQQFGKLTVLKLVPKEHWINKTGRAYWYVKCSCGSEQFLASSDNLRRRRTTHCGCVKQQNALKHGMSHSPEYRAWSSMIQRCTNPNASGYERYGGRGIQVCQDWIKDFEAFYQSVGPKPSADYTLDRIDNNGNYEPDNVRWASKSWQTKN